MKLGEEPEAATQMAPRRKPYEEMGVQICADSLWQQHEQSSEAEKSGWKSDFSIITGVRVMAA